MNELDIKSFLFTNFKSLFLLLYNKKLNIIFILWRCGFFFIFDTLICAYVTILLFIICFFLLLIILWNLTIIWVNFFISMFLFDFYYYRGYTIINDILVELKINEASDLMILYVLKSFVGFKTCWIIDILLSDIVFLWYLHHITSFSLRVLSFSPSLYFSPFYNGQGISWFYKDIFFLFHSLYHNIRCKVLFYFHLFCLFSWTSISFEHFHAVLPLFQDKF